MSALHPSIQVGSEVAVRDLVAPWAFLGRRLWSIYRVERIALDRSGRYDVRTTTGQCWFASELRPLTDEIQAEAEHEARLCRLWTRLRCLTQYDELEEWPERLTLDLVARLEDLLSDIEAVAARPEAEGEVAT